MMGSISKLELIKFSQRIEKLWEEARIPFPIHLSGGNEDQLINLFKEIKDGDYIFSTHRSHYHYLLAGGSQKKLEEMIFDGRSMHICDKHFNFIASSIVAGLPCVAAGTALALKRKSKKNKVWCFVGDGAEDEGHFYEAVRYVQGWHLPCTFVIEDNDRSVETTKKERYGESIINWPDCVRRYEYTATYPHVGIGRFVNFSKVKQNTTEIQKEKNNFFLKDKKFNGSYKAALDESMKRLSKNENIVFLGYNICSGSQAYDSLKDIATNQKIEMPVAENLIVGLATGMSLIGIKPVVFFERQDFMLNGLDAMVNHLDKIALMSHGEFKTPVIIRATIGCSEGIDPGPQHKGNYTESFKGMIKNFPIYEPHTPGEVIAVYEKAIKMNTPIMIIEKKELFQVSDSEETKYL